jgi:hypothetical protein
MKAAWVFSFNAEKNSLNAPMPPAEAPMAQTKAGAESKSRVEFFDRFSPKSFQTKLRNT